MLSHSLHEESPMRDVDYLVVDYNGINQIFYEIHEDLFSLGKK